MTTTPALLAIFLFGLPTLAQDVNYRGRVLDKAGMPPVPGATVRSARSCGSAA